MAIIRLLICFFLSFFQLITPVGKAALRAISDTQFEKWSVEQKYTSDYAVELEKTPGKDFVVLNLADVQLQDNEVGGDAGSLAEKMIEKLIEDNQPDLITLSGDNAWSTVSYARIVAVVDSYGIPWAPVMGNHDGQGTIGEWWCAGLFCEAENCLWKNGPEDMGWGNYIINITENGHVIHTFFMMDTHSGATYTLPDGTTTGGYDHLWDNQLEWYKWAVEGIAEQEGKTVESTIVIHIPPVETTEVYKVAYDSANGTYVGEFAESGFGVNHEEVCCPPVNNGMFALCKELGSTKTILYGHDHVNSASFEYEGIRLTYGLKLGSACYWEKEMSGGTTITINDNGNATVEHHYIDADTLDYQIKLK